MKKTKQRRRKRRGNGWRIRDASPDSIYDRWSRCWRCWYNWRWRRWFKKLWEEREKNIAIVAETKRVIVCCRASSRFTACIVIPSLARYCLHTNDDDVAVKSLSRVRYFRSSSHSREVEESERSRPVDMIYRSIFTTHEMILPQNSYTLCFRRF